MKKGKQILAIIGIILLIVLYLSTFGMRHHRQYRNHENVQSFYLCHLRDPGTDLGLYVLIQTYAQEIIIFLLFL